MMDTSEGIHPAYGQIPIFDCGEALLAIPALFPRLEPHPYVAAGAPYAGHSPWFLRSGVLLALENAQAELQRQRPGWRIAIFDAWRPLQVQAYMVWRQFLQEAEEDGVSSRLQPYDSPFALREQEPELYQRLAPRVYRFWGVPNPDPARPPPHSTGAALDCTLLDAEGALVPMGGPVDDFSDRAVPEYFAKAPAGSTAADYHRHRELLRAVLASQDFVQHPGEWWHFSLGDQLWAWRLGAAQARYGRVTAPAGGASKAPAPTASAGKDCPSRLAGAPPAHRC